MSAENFIKFYSDHLAKNPSLKTEIDGSADQRDFLASVLKHGKAAGFDFVEADVDQVMRASLKKTGGELDEKQLDGVVGGAGGADPHPTVKVATIKSVNVGNLGSAPANTIMCTGWGVPGGDKQNPAQK
jgi:hypothetical protein